MLNIIIVLKKHILRFKIPMYYLFGMHRDQRLQYASHYYCGIILIILTFLADPFEQFTPIEMLQYQMNIVK